MSVLTRPSPGTPREFRFPRLERFLLSNGFKVVVAPMHRLPLVTALVIVDVGATSDPAGKEGVSELTARSLLEGTAELAGAELIDALEKMGTSISSSADWDATILKMTFLRPKLDDAIQLVADLLRAPRFDNRDIVRLKNERLANILQILAEPRTLANEMFSAYLYSPQSRYSKPAGGTEASVSSLVDSDVNEFHAFAFSPAATTLVLTGDITSKHARELAEKMFGDWNVIGRPRTAATYSASHESRRAYIQSRPGAPQSELRLGHIGPARSTADYFANVVMNAIFGGLFSSRINLNLREAHGYTYSASSYFDWRRGPGPFIVSTAVQSEVTGPAIAETLSEIDRIRTSEVNGDELSLATSYLAGVFPIRYETTEAVASGIANIVIFNLPENYFDTYRQMITRVDAAAVLSAAKRNLDPEKFQVVVVGDPGIIVPQIESLDLGPLEIHDSPAR